MVDSQVHFVGAPQFPEKLKQFTRINFKTNSAFDTVDHGVEFVDHFSISRQQSTTFHGRLGQGVLDHPVKDIFLDVDGMHSKKTDRVGRWLHPF